MLKKFVKVFKNMMRTVRNSFSEKRSYTPKSTQVVAYKYYADDTPLTITQIETEMEKITRFLFSVSDERGIFKLINSSHKFF